MSSGTISKLDKILKNYITVKKKILIHDMKIIASQKLKYSYGKLLGNSNFII